MGGYFTFEWVVRFCSFQQKRNGLKDAWFVFDTALCALMILETWVLQALLVFSGGSVSFDASAFRLLRLLRLTRTARMAKVLRAMPELLIMIKGMIAAARSVFFTLMLLIIIIYIYAIAYRQLTSGVDDWTSGPEYFKTVPDAMLALLLHGTFPDNAEMCYVLMEDHWIMLFMQFTF